MSAPPYAELHCHSHFSFLDGASSAEDLVARALELGLSALAVTDHGGLYGAVRFVAAAEAAGLRPIVGLEVELLDAAVADPHRLVVPRRRAPRRGATEEETASVALDGRPARPHADRLRLPGHREPLREDLRGIGDAARGPHLVLLARDATGYRSLCRLVSAAHLAGTKGVPRYTHALLESHADGLVALTGCRHSEIARRLLAGDRAGAAAAARHHAATYAPVPGLGAGVFLELQHHLLADDDWLVAETARLAAELGLPVVVTNDVHYARRDDHELADVLVAIRHGRTLDESAHLRRPNAEYHLKSAAELTALPPAEAETDPTVRRAWAEGLRTAEELGSRCSVDLGFEQYRFPGFAVPQGETPLSHLAGRCQEGARAKYHPVTPRVRSQLAHELDVIERTGLAEFFLVCADLMRFAKARGIPAQGRGSAGDSIVAYVLGITRVDPIRHNLLFERFLNEGRTAYPDIDIDFASSRREEVIRYVYERYGAEHTGMVCNVVTYRARSAVREVGNALGFPRPLVDRVAKALETYDAVRVRRDLEADGGFAEFFRAPRDEVEANARLDHRSGSDQRTGNPAAQAGAPTDALAPRSTLRRGPADDEGGPGDTPASAARLHPRPRTEPRTEPRAVPRAVPRAGSTVGLSPWERWLELCARIDGFPRHLSIHVGGMLVTAAPLVDIAPLERATMPGRAVVQYDKRDVETLKLIKLDLLGLRMLSAIDDALRAITADCGVCVDLDRLPEDLPEVFAMIVAADTVGVFQIESRAQMQTLPKSRPATLDDLVVEVAIIRPGPIQGNAVHPYLRRRQGIEPVRYLHSSLEPILRETLGVILYQEQVMEIAIAVAGFSPAESDGFRRAMGTWRSDREMEKLHDRFVAGCLERSGLAEADAEELYRQVAAFASFGFNKSHAAAFARTAYESAFLKLYYPAQFLIGLVNNQPMGFYPVEVLINDAKRHGVAILPVDLQRSAYRTTTEWVGLPGEPLPDGCGIGRRPPIVRSAACVVPDPVLRGQWAAESAQGYGVRLGLHLVRGIGEELGARLDAEQARGPYRLLADVVARTGLSAEVIERLIRVGGLDSLGRPRRELLWQLREVAGSTGRVRQAGGPSAAATQLDLRLPPTEAPELPPPSELERLADSYAILSLDARRQVVELFRPALERLGARPISRLSEHPPGRIRIGGLVVTRQHPMTAKGTVFLALEDETGMANVTLWPDTWARLRTVVRRHALLLVEGQLQRKGAVVNLVAQRVWPLPDAARSVGGPGQPEGVRQLGYAGTRRSG